jgi:hypothetical protein
MNTETQKNLSIQRITPLLSEWLIYIGCALTFISNQYQTIAIGLAIVFHLFSTTGTKIKNSILRNKNETIAFLLFFFLNAFSALFFFNENSVGAIETKFAFFIFPLLLPSLRNKINLTLLFSSAIIGILCMFSIYYLSTFHIVESNIPDGSHPFVNNLHPSYISIIACCLLHLLIVYLIQKKNKYNILFYLVPFIILVTLITLSESKIGYVALLTIIIFNFSYLIYKAKNWKVSIIAIISFLGVVVFTSLQSSIYTRFEEAYQEIFTPHPDPNYVMSTGERLIAWKASTELIGEHLWLGVGAGNEKTELTNYYSTHNNINNAELRLDSHQQFLQSALAGGIFVAISLVLIFTLLIFNAIKSRNIYLMGVVIIYFLFAMTESVFERQSGIIPFVFLVFVLLNYTPEKFKIFTFTTEK